jgi:hypothetical protein
MVEPFGKVDDEINVFGLEGMSFLAMDSAGMESMPSKVYFLMIRNAHNSFLFSK